MNWGCVPLVRPPKMKVEKKENKLAKKKNLVKLFKIIFIHRFQKFLIKI